VDDFAPTSEQQAVIDHRGRNLLIFAGPGTGKTETLARRFASLVADDGIDPSRIVVLTFSRRAAEEMRERILLRLRQRLKEELAVTELFIGTFHAFCSRLLDADAPRFGRKDLLTPVRERLLFEQVVIDESLPLACFGGVRDSKQFAVDGLNFIAQIKGQGVAVQRLAAIAGDDPPLRDLARIYRALDGARRRKGLRDFRDLVIDALDALADPDNAASAWLGRRRFAHVLVDEFQDSDGVQLRLLLAMRDAIAGSAGPAPEFCFVGDVNQSIYRFRGAMPANVETARHAFDCAELGLATNRRSAQGVLDVANRDPRLSQTSLTAAEDRSRPGSVALRLCETFEDEVDAVCDGIAGELATGVPMRDTAVLLRQAEPYRSAIAQELARRGILVAANAKADFADDVLIDAVATALRLLEDEQPTRLWMRLLANPLVGFSARTVGMAFEDARRAKIDAPLAALRAFPPALRAAARRTDFSFISFLAGWRRCRRMHRRGDPAELIRAIVRELRLLEAAASNDLPMGYDRHASPARLDELLTAARDYAQAPPPAGSRIIERFVARLDDIFDVLTNAYQPPANDVDGVRVMTIHAAKGLEFSFVAIPQLLDGVLPAAARRYPMLTSRSIAQLDEAGVPLFVDPDEALREESSLWYVALTRAKTKVLATAPLLDDEGVEQQLSPFADFIGAPSDGAAKARSTRERPFRRVVHAMVRQPDGIEHPGVREFLNERPVLKAIVGARAIGPIDPAERRHIVLPIEKLSPSAIDRYVACPRRFFYQDVLRVPEDSDKDAASYGEVVHAALRRFHEEARDFSQPFDGSLKAAYIERLRALVHEELDALGRSLGIPSESALMRYQQAALGRQLEGYVEYLQLESAAHPFVVLECEKSVEFAVDGLRIGGTVDRIDRLSIGALAIRDYKSGKFQKPDAAAKLAKALEKLDKGERLYGDAPHRLAIQTLLYAPGVEALFGEPVKRADYIFLRGADGRSTYVDSMAIAQNDAERVRFGAETLVTPADAHRVIEAIAAGIAVECRSGGITAFDTARDPLTCRFCGYTRVCPGAGMVAFSSMSTT